MQNFSRENEIYLHETEKKTKKTFLHLWLRTSPRFETEAWGYSEMAYSLERLRLK